MINKLEVYSNPYKEWGFSVLAMGEQRRTRHQEKEMIRGYIRTTEQRRKDERPSEDGQGYQRSKER